jgi:hypothetical protein
VFNVWRTQSKGQPPIDLAEGLAPTAKLGTIESEFNYCYIACKENGVFVV